MNKEFEHRDCRRYGARFCRIQPEEYLVCQFNVFRIFFQLKNEDGCVERDSPMTREEFREQSVLYYQDPRSLVRYLRG